MKKSTLAKAVTLAATGTLLSFGAATSASAHVMYSTGTFGGTDGWTLSGGSSQTGTPVPWLGTTGGALPFGFQAGGQALNWAAAIHHAGSTLEVSAAHALSAYGAVVDIDTANGAWGSWQVDPNNPTFTRGWAHNTDYGLIKSDIDTTVRIDVSKVNPSDNIFNYGITVFTGMDDQTGPGYNHHSPWNVGYVSGTNEAPAMVDNPHDTGGLAYLTHGDSSYVEFFATAGQVYSVYLGGNDIGGDIFGTPYTYKVDISAVPVPAAVWLFGSGVLGLATMGRRKLQAA